MSQNFKKENCKCGGKMTQAKVTRTIPLAGKNVKVENIKAFVCEECGETYLDGPSLLKLESKLMKRPVLART
jgi:YgiT-type zinc finger domain-containing protein